MTPWQHLELVRSEHARARARVQCAEQLTHLGPDRARELVLAQEDERQRAAQVAEAEKVVEALRREAEERARIVEPDRGDREVLDVLDRLSRQLAPEVWESWLRKSADPVDRRALAHLGWLLELRRTGPSVEDWRRGVRLR